MTRRVSNRAIVEALRATMGKVNLAAERLGCPSGLIFERARKCSQIDDAIRFFRGKLLDAAESSLWKAVLDRESWAVRLTFDLWGAAHDFSDGAENWHSPRSTEKDFPPQLVRTLIEGILGNHGTLIETVQVRHFGPDAGDLRLHDQPRPLEDGAAPGGDRPGDRRHDLGKDAPRPGD